MHLFLLHYVSVTHSDIDHRPSLFLLFFFFNDTATTEIYTLSLHDALPISISHRPLQSQPGGIFFADSRGDRDDRSEEHTSELQSRLHLVCRLLLEKKKKHTLNHLSD